MVSEPEVGREGGGGEREAGEPEDCMIGKILGPGFVRYVVSTILWMNMDPPQPGSDVTVTGGFTDSVQN